MTKKKARPVPGKSPGSRRSDPTLAKKPSVAYAPLAFIALYMLLDVVPSGDVIVGAMRHRFYADVLNLAVAGYVLSNYGRLFARAVPAFFRQVVPVLYGVFVLLSALSISVAVNPTEGWVDVAAYFSNFVSFVHIFALLYGARENIRFVALLATAILFCEVGIELYSFFTNLGTKPVAQLAYAMKWHTGNKNIFSASIIVRLVFVIYACFRTKGFWRAFSYVTLFLSVVAVFVLSARASYLSLIAIVLLVGIGQLLLYRKELSVDRTPLYRSLALFGIFLAGFLITNPILTKHADPTGQLADDEFVTDGKSYIGNRLGSITDFENRSTNIRFHLWISALEKAREHPLLGIGAGNYRVHSSYLMADIFRYDAHAKYTHNDFVQIATESGFPAGVAYLLIFAFALFHAVRIWAGPAYSREQQFVAILLLGGLIGFFVDSVFNFPLKRINMNVPFLITLSLILLNYLEVRPKSDAAMPPAAWARYGYIALLAVFLGAAYVDYQVFESGKAQYVIRGDSGDMDYGNPKVSMTYEQVDKLLSGRFPSIGDNNQPIAMQKAKYLFAEKRYAEALSLMPELRARTPYSLHYEVFSKRLHAALGNLDSALHYSAFLLEKRPYNEDDYKVTMELAKYQKKPDAVRRAYALHAPYIPGGQGYSSFVAAMLQAGHDFTDDLATLDKGLEQYPENEDLQKVRAHFALLSDLKAGRIAMPARLPRIVLKNNEDGETRMTFLN